MRRILLLGADGLLGSTLLVQFSDNQDFELITTARKITADFNFTYSPRALSRLVEETRPDIVINCIASTSSNTSFRKSLTVNSLLPIQLAYLSSKHKYVVIHLSTNAVFSGRSRRNTERTFPRPKTKYGLTKLIGDLSSYRNMVIRTSFIGVSPNPSVKSGMVERLRNTPTNGHILIQDDSSWNGITSSALSEIICAIIQNGYVVPGIFHIGSSKVLSKCELIKIILTLLNRNDVTVSIADQNPRRNLSLVTNKDELISSWWSQTKYKTAPEIARLLSDSKII